MGLFTALASFKTNLQAQCTTVTADLIAPYPQTVPYPSYGVKVTLAYSYTQNVTVTGTIGVNGSNMDGWQLVIPAGSLTSQTASDYYTNNSTSATPDIEIGTVTPCPPPWNNRYLCWCYYNI